MNPAFFKQPPSCASLWRELRQLEAAHPQVRLFRGGRSACGRELPVLGIGNLRRAVLFAGGVHGQEWLTTLLLVRFAWAFAAASSAWRCNLRWRRASLRRSLAASMSFSI